MDKKKGNSDSGAYRSKEWKKKDLLQEEGGGSLTVLSSHSILIPFPFLPSFLVIIKTLTP